MMGVSMMTSHAFLMRPRGCSRHRCRCSASARANDAASSSPACMPDCRSSFCARSPRRELEERARAALRTCGPSSSSAESLAPHVSGAKVTRVAVLGSVWDASPFAPRRGLLAGSPAKGEGGSRGSPPSAWTPPPPGPGRPSSSAWCVPERRGTARVLRPMSPRLAKPAPRPPSSSLLLPAEPLVMSRCTLRPTPPASPATWPTSRSVPAA